MSLKHLPNGLVTPVTIASASPAETIDAVSVVDAVGYDDKDPSAKLVMQEAERRHLLRFGIEHRVEPPKN